MPALEEGDLARERSDDESERPTERRVTCRCVGGCTRLSLASLHTLRHAAVDLLAQRDDVAAVRRDEGWPRRIAYVFAARGRSRFLETLGPGPVYGIIRV